MFKLEIDTGNAAFTDNPEELADILRKLADRLSGATPENDSGVIRDSNGNRVGAWNATA